MEIKSILTLTFAFITLNIVKAQEDSTKVIHNQTIINNNNTLPPSPPPVTPKPDTVVKTVPVPVPAPPAHEPEKTDIPLKHGEFGIRYEPTWAMMSFRTYGGQAVKGDLAISHGVGAMLAGNFNKYVGVQLEVNYYSSTQQFKDRNVTNKVSLSYVNVPLMLSLNTNKTWPVNLNAVVGPQFGINAGGKVTTEGTNDNSDTLHAIVAVKQGDVGLAYGLGLEIALTKFHELRLDFGYRGFYGLVDMDSKQVSNNTYSIIVSARRQTNAAYVGLTLCF